MISNEISSAKIIADQTRIAITELLKKRGICDLDGYGWLNANDYDPELIGHAMRQTDSLSFRVLQAHMEVLQSQSTAVPKLSPWQRFLIRSGGDFEGLMDTARLSIGLALFHHEAGNLSAYEVDSFFQLHLIAAMVTLGSASDRLRDLYVAAAFGEETDRYKKTYWRRKGDRRLYDTPFREAEVRLLNNSDAAKSASTLPPLAAEVQTYRDRRNVIVHDLATESGRQHQDIANSPSPTPYSELFELDHAAAIELSARAEAARLKRISDDLEHPIRWYKLLVELSNHVFIVENVLRRSQAP